MTSSSRLAVDWLRLNNNLILTSVFGDRIDFVSPLLLLLAQDARDDRPGGESGQTRPLRSTGGRLEVCCFASRNRRRSRSVRTARVDIDPNIGAGASYACMTHLYIVEDIDKVTLLFNNTVSTTMPPIYVSLNVKDKAQDRGGWNSFMIGTSLARMNCIYSLARMN